MAAQAAVFHTAKRHVRFIINRAVVNVGDACFQPLGNRQPFLFIACDDTGRQPVLGGVGDLNRFIYAANGDNWRDRAKGFFTKDVHGGGHVGQHSRLVEEAVVAAAGSQFGSLGDGFGYVSVNFVELLLVDDRADNVAHLARVADLERFYFFNETFGKFIGYGLIYSLWWAALGGVLVIAGIYGWALEPADDDENPHGHDDHDDHDPSGDDAVAADEPVDVPEEAPVG